MNLLDILAWLLAVTSGVTAGIYLVFSMVIMPAFAKLETSAAIKAMNSVNRTILKTSFMPLFFGSTIVAAILGINAIWSWGEVTSLPALITGLIYCVGMFIVTATSNVPLNNQLDHYSGDEPNAEAMWQHYYVAWTRWNSLRALACSLTMLMSIFLINL